MSEPVRYRWRFNAEDDDGESHALLREAAKRNAKGRGDGS